MTVATTIAAYLAVGFAATSALHTWYAGHVYDRLSFGLPFSPRLRVERPVRDGYVGSVAVGVLVFLAAWTYLAVAVPPAGLTVETLLQRRLTGVVAGVGALVVASQLLGGASWSKVVLDATLAFMAFVVLVAHLQPPTFWNLFTVYAAIVPPLGASWGVWREYFIEMHVSEGAPDSVLYPHFPSFTYFVGASLYVLVGSLYLLVPTVA